MTRKRHFGRAVHQGVSSYSFHHIIQKSHATYIFTFWSFFIYSSGNTRHFRLGRSDICDIFRTVQTGPGPLYLKVKTNILVSSHMPHSSWRHLELSVSLRIFSNFRVWRKPHLQIMRHKLCGFRSSHVKLLLSIVIYDSKSGLQLVVIFIINKSVDSSLN